MKLIKTITEMQSWSGKEHAAGKKIAFVPTMGALHKGHLSLLREGKERANRSVLSIYVNPAQFSPNEDLKKYPRNLDSDLDNARKLKIDAVFLPTDEMMYPYNYQTYVVVEKLTTGLCGASRPNHFRGMATVVLKLFNIIQPDLAIFGEKDFQQLMVVRQMVKDLNLPIEIIGVPIVREKDGLAMSSRNQHLSPKERKSALSIYRSLCMAQKLVKTEKITSDLILENVKAIIDSAELKIDYVELCDPETLEKSTALRLPALLAIAAFAGKTRLIDNCILK